MGKELREHYPRFRNINGCLTSMLGVSKSLIVLKMLIELMERKFIGMKNFIKRLLIY